MKLPKWLQIAHILVGVATVAAAIFVKNAKSKQIVSAAEAAAAAALNANDFTQPRPIVSADAQNAGLPLNPSL